MANTFFRLFISFFLLFFFRAEAQDLKIDSLAKELLALPQGPQKAEKYIDLAWELRTDNQGLMFHYLNQAMAMAEEIEYHPGKARALFITGQINFLRHNNPSALTYFEQALVYYRSLSDKDGMVKCLNGMVIIYKNQGNLEKALALQLENLQHAEAIADSAELALSYDNLGEIYLQKGDHHKALFYYEKAFSLKSESGKNTEGVIRTLNNLGNVYARIGNLEQAEQTHLHTIELAEKEGFLVLMAEGKGDLAAVMVAQKRFVQAEQIIHQAIEVHKQQETWRLLAEDYEVLAQLHFNQQNWQDAYRYAQISFAHAKKVGALQILNQAVKIMTESAEKSGDYYAAFIAQNEWLALKDTLSSLQRDQVMEQLSFQYELEKRESENQLLKVENTVNKETIHNQQLLTAGVVVILLFFLVTAFKFRKQKKVEHRINDLLRARNSEIARQNDDLKKQNEEILRQRNLLEESKKEIEVINQELGKQRNQIEFQHHQLEEANLNLTDSIRYAQKMQQAMLPKLEAIQLKLPESFIFFVPRDVVSGDFYWHTTTSPQAIFDYAQDNPFFEATKVFKGIENEKIMMVIADCTGHGVPGAFMSMKGDALLNQIIVARGIHRPDKVLNELHREIRKAFHQYNNENHDGMDLAMVAIDLEKRSLEFAGAKIPLYLFNDSAELEVIKGDLYSIGGEQWEEERKFTLHHIQLKKDCSIFISTDGYQDQFGGHKGKKFMSGRFKELLTELRALPARKQHERLSATFFDWKMEEEQVDDVLVFGAKLS